jgi:hypothetical protein
MRIGDDLYFSPRFRFSEINLDDSGKVVEAVKDRVFGYYLAPASRLLEVGDAFAAGLLCCAAVDFFALFLVKEDPETWLRENIPEFSRCNENTGKFWQWFRHGLVHEGRVKAFGQFSLDFQTMLNRIDGALVVNPQLLLDAVQSAMNSYFEKLDEHQTDRIVKHVRRHFSAEIAVARG